jgi:Na+-translocating ferredoxin:NAD+ oxidoreductase RNF subunit RnfB
MHALISAALLAGIQTPSVAAAVAWPAVLLGATGLVLGLGLAVAARKLAVEKDPLVARLEGLLPGANCGGCGLPGCSGFAAALAKGKAEPSGCVAANPAILSSLASALGVDLADKVRRIASIQCNGGHSAVRAFEYDGPSSCTSAMLVMGGDRLCRFGCLGMGDCIRVCPFGAMSMGVNGVPVIDRQRCTGCGKCVQTCPKRIITLWPADRDVVVACSNREKGAVARKACTVACIACGKCEKACPVSAITITENLSRIDPAKCINCGLCATVCPTGAILDRAPARPRAYIESSCVGCTVCAKICPTQAITGELKQQHVVDTQKCVGCGMCAPKCPKNSIRMVGALSYRKEGI